jgi:hypothetical protein
MEFYIEIFFSKCNYTMGENAYLLCGMLQAHEIEVQYFIASCGPSYKGLPNSSFKGIAFSGDSLNLSYG